jgi:hypothetical protein
MLSKYENIVNEVIKKLKEVSSTGTGGASMSPGEGSQYATKYSFKGKKNPAIYYYRLGFKNVPKIKPKSYDKKQLWEDEIINEYNDFQQERINAFSKLESELNQITALISNAKDQTAEFYSANPGSYEVVVATDLILDYLQNIKTLLKGEE